LGFPLVVTVEGGTLGVQAPGADDVEAKMERMLYPQNSRGTPEPWQERG
jgi:hypothetical protein